MINTMIQMGLDLISYFTSMVIFLVIAVMIVAMLWKLVDFICGVDFKAVKIVNHGRVG